MNSIKVNIRPIENDETFILILPSRQSYQVGAMYHIIDYFSDDILAYKCLAFKETLEIGNLTDFHTFLAKNMHKDLFYRCMKNQFKTRLTEQKYQTLSVEMIKYKVGDLYSFINKQTLVDVCLFTNYSHTKEYEKRVKNTFKYPDEFESLLSKKPVISSNYCHKSLWNFEQQRPFTKYELLKLNQPTNERLFNNGYVVSDFSETQKNSN